VLLQFLAEAVILSITGGIAGIVIGVAFSAVISLILTARSGSGLFLPVAPPDSICELTWRMIIRTAAPRWDRAGQLSARDMARNRMTFVIRLRARRAGAPEAYQQEA
jgi:ABC-type antimicrobial peptide transport system permease subunit